MTQTLTKKHINPRIARWALQMENFHYKILHRASDSMGHVDALSRCLNMVAAVDTNDIDFQLQIAQNRDANILGLRDQLEKDYVKDYRLINGLVYKAADGRFMFYVPAELEDNIIRNIHEKVGHQSVDKCYEQLKLNYWFPKMKPKIESFIQNCIRCLFNAAPLRKDERNLYNIPKTPIPFHTIQQYTLIIWDHCQHYNPRKSIFWLLLMC